MSILVSNERSQTGEFGVSEIRDIQWNDSALENLVLGESEKRLLRGIVSSQKDQKRTGFDDFVQGKGELYCAIAVEA